VPELFHCTAKNANFTGELRGNVCIRQDYSVYALSVAGHERAISFLVAALSKGEGGCTLTFEECRELWPGNPYAAGADKAFSLYPATGGFTCHRQHLQHPDWRSDTWHLLAVSKNPNFLLDGGDEALWRVLRGEQYTTPLLRQWVPALRQTLTAGGLLRPCAGIGWQSQMLTAKDADLDRLVSEGIRSGKLKFTPQALEEAA